MDIPLEVEGEKPDINTAPNMRDSEQSLQNDKPGKAADDKADFDKSLDDYLGSDDAKDANDNAGMGEKPKDDSLDPIEETPRQRPQRNVDKIHKLDGKVATNDFGMMQEIEKRNNAEAKKLQAKTEPAAKAPVKPEGEAKTPPVDPAAQEFPEPKDLKTPASKEQWKGLRDAYHKAKAESEQYKSNLAQKEQQAVNGIPKEVVDEINELRAFRAAYDVTSDPEFMKSYFEPLRQTEEGLLKHLESQGLSKERLDMMVKTGIHNVKPEVWSSMINRIRDGVEGETPEASAAPDPVAARRLERLLEEHATMREKQEAAVKDAPKRVEEYRAKRIQAFEQQRGQELSYVQDRLKQAQELVPWAQEREIPASATEEERASIEKHNRYYKMASETFETAFNPSNIQQRTETAMAAALSRIQAEEIKDFQAENAALKSQVERYRNAGKINRNAITTTGVNNNKVNSTNRMNMKTEDAVESLLREVEGT